MGKRINSMSSNPDAQAGKRGGRVLDEFALHPDPRKLWAIAYPGITWGGSMEVISTHRGSHNFFNQLVREYRENGNPKKISLHRVTLEDALSDGFLFKLQQSLPDDDERQDMTEAEYFDWVRKGCADEESFLQEYMCQPADDDAAFLEYDLIASCEYPENANWRLTEGRQLYAGLDIGRKKDLTVLWVVEKLGDVLYTRHVEALRNMSKPDQEKILWPWLEKCVRTCIDATGLGIGWADDARRNSVKRRSRPLPSAQRPRKLWLIRFDRRWKIGACVSPMTSRSAQTCDLLLSRSPVQAISVLRPNGRPTVTPTISGHLLLQSRRRAELLALSGPVTVGGDKDKNDRVAAFANALSGAATFGNLSRFLRM